METSGSQRGLFSQTRSRPSRGFAVADAVEGDDGGVSTPNGPEGGGGGVGGVVVDEKNIGEGRVQRASRIGRRAHARRADCWSDSWVSEYLARAVSPCHRTGGREAAALAIIGSPFHRRENARERLGGIRGGAGPRDAAAPRPRGGRAATARVGKPTSSSAPARRRSSFKASFDLTVDYQGCASIMSVPDADHGVEPFIHAGGLAGSFSGGRALRRGATRRRARCQGIGQRDLGKTRGARPLVGGNLRHSETGSEGRNDHLQLDGGVAGAQLKLPEDVGANRAKPVLRIGQARAETAVDQVGDERGPGEAKKLVAAAVQFVRAAEQAGTGDMVGLARSSGARPALGCQSGSWDPSASTKDTDKGVSTRADGEAQGGALAKSLVAARRPTPAAAATSPRCGRWSRLRRR